ncbi:16357_t:CDS:1, partial [Funneliformis mosseae]
MGLASYLIVTTVGGVAVVLGAPVILKALGFSATGIVAGSLAAAAHSYIGVVSAGSVFACLTSKA